MNFNDSLKFFLEKEKVHSEMDMELDDKGHKVMRNGNGRKRHQFIPCISKELYDDPVSNGKGRVGKFLSDCQAELGMFFNYLWIYAVKCLRYSFKN